jgi:glycosyltransferase involved in cell wall biosynthesis
LQDNLPNTIVEAMSCGTPCVGFNVGGIPEMISHELDGYVARYRDSQDFAHGIIWCLDDSCLATLRQKARADALNTYSESAVASRYQEIYRSLLG